VTSLPKTPIKGDPETRRFLEAVRQYLTQVGKDSITLQDLRDTGFWDRNNIPVPTTGTDEQVDAPRVPTNLTAEGVFQNIILSWDYLDYRGHAWTRVYRSNTNVFANAVVIANVNGKLFSDPVGPSQSFYYWVTNVNVNGIESAPNQVAGTLGQTLQDTAYILSLLNGSITESQLYATLGSRINLIDGNGIGSVNARIAAESADILAQVEAADLNIEAELRNYTDSQISSSSTALTNSFNSTLTGYVTNATLAANYYTAAGTNSAIAAATQNLATKTELGAYVTTATLTQNYYTKTGTDSAISAATTNLATKAELGGYVTTASLTANYYTKSDTDSAISAATLNLATKTELSGYVTNSTLTTNYYTKTATDSAISSATQNLVSTSALSNYVTNATLTNNYYTKTDTDGAISVATQNLVSNTQLANYVTTATLTNSYYTKTQTDSAISSATQNFVSTTTLNGYVTTATLTNNYYTKTATDSAISSSVGQVSARLNNFNSSGVSVEQSYSAQASSIGGLQGQYTVKIDNNGYVSGFGLASTAINATPTSSFIVRADRFSIASPSGPGITPTNPFTVLTTPTVINGVTVQPGVYITNATIMDGAITNAKIGALAVDQAKIADLAVVNAKIANGAITTAKIDNLQVTNAKIADAAITTAKIDNLQVNNAKIADLTIGTEKVQDLAITRSSSYFNNFSGWSYPTDGVWYDLAGYSGYYTYSFVGYGNGAYEYDAEFGSYIYVGPGAGSYNYVYVGGGGGLSTGVTTSSTIASGVQSVHIDASLVIQRDGGSDDDMRARCVRTNDSYILPEYYEKLRARSGNSTYALFFRDQSPIPGVLNTYKIQFYNNSDNSHFWECSMRATLYRK